VAILDVGGVVYWDYAHMPHAHTRINIHIRPDTQPHAAQAVRGHHMKTAAMGRVMHLEQPSACDVSSTATRRFIMCLFDVCGGMWLFVAALCACPCAGACAWVCVFMHACMDAWVYVRMCLVILLTHVNASMHMCVSREPSLPQLSSQMHLR